MIPVLQKLSPEEELAQQRVFDARRRVMEDILREQQYLDSKLRRRRDRFWRLALLERKRYEERRQWVCACVLIVCFFGNIVLPFCAAFAAAAKSLDGV